MTITQCLKRSVIVLLILTLLLCIFSLLEIQSPNWMTLPFRYYNLNVTIYPEFLNSTEQSTETQSNSSITLLFSNTSTTTQHLGREQCPFKAPGLRSRINVTLTNLTYTEIEDVLATELTPNLTLGGKWRPSKCLSLNKIAIIVPYRNRDYNLRLFLLHMHRLLSKQLIDYGVYLIQPTKKLVFNRGLLMNIGYKEALKDNPNWQCVVLHDVDLLPESELNIYSCPQTPRHMSSAVSTFKYKIPYEDIFGGVTAFRNEHYERINGFSNMYFGWGGEDDDCRIRVIARGYKVERTPVDIGRYTMAKHGRDSLNPANPDRHKLINQAKKRMAQDGLNSLKYRVISVTKTALFTKILVSYPKSF